MREDQGHKRLLRVVSYNPCNAKEQFRMDEISYALHNQDVIGLAGTGKRAWGANQHIPTIRQALHHWEISWDWARSASTNKSCGGTILLRKQRFPKPTAQRLFHPPASLIGRVGMLELMGAHRLAPGFVYFPPRPLRNKDKALYRRTVSAIFDFLYESIAQLRGGAQPLLFIDLNDLLGKPQFPDEAREDDLFIGNIDPGDEEFAATKLRRFLRDVGMCAVNTFYDAGPTFWSTRQTGKRIEVILVPVDWMEDCESCTTLKWTGRQLQLAHTLRNWDHWPIAATFKRLEQHQPRGGPRPQQPKWDQEAMGQCLLEGKERQKLLTRLGEVAEKYDSEFDNAFCSDPTADGMDELLIKIYKEAATGLFYDVNNPDQSLPRTENKANAMRLAELLAHRKHCKMQLARIASLPQSAHCAYTDSINATHWELIRLSKEMKKT